MHHAVQKLISRYFLVGAACVVPAMQAWAAPPSWAGNNKSSQAAPADQSKPSSGQVGVSFSFSNEDRRVANEYYGRGARQGKCPPGLAKKNNGCQPPGQAKKWSKGQPLARDVVYYPIPNELRIKLPAPPPNHRYVRVARDILLIAIGTKIVIDAMEDILR